MASYQIDETAPYRSANGHTMIAPIYTSDRPDAKPYKISAYAYCTDTCSACSGGDRPEYYAGEEW